MYTESTQFIKNGSYSNSSYYTLDQNEGVTKKSKSEEEKDKTVSLIGTVNISCITGSISSTRTTPGTEYITPQYGGTYTRSITREVTTTTLINGLGASLSLYRGSPFKGDGEVPIIIHSLNTVALSTDTYQSLNLDSCITSFIDNHLIPLYWKGLDCYWRTFIHDSPLRKSDDSIWKTTCVIPLSEYIDQSEQLQAIYSISKKDLAFLQVKNGEIQSISVKPFGSYSIDNFVITYIQLKQNDDFTFSLNRSSLSGEGYLTKRLSINYLSNSKYTEKAKSILKILDPKSEHLDLYKSSFK